VSQARGPLGPALTVSHWYGFDRRLDLDGGSLQSPASWDALRASDPTGSFGFGASRQQWVAKAQSNPLLTAQADQIVTLLRGWSAPRLVSVGVGTALLEYLIKSAMPEVILRCGDYAASSVEVLRTLFTDCQSIDVMDLRDPTWVADPAEVVLLNRVDMEIRDHEWAGTFSRLASMKVQHIILIPCGLLTPLAVVREIRSVLAALRRRRRLARAGYLRTQRRLLDLFSPGYKRLAVAGTADLPIWALRRRDD
jgi:hypothetical protein